MCCFHVYVVAMIGSPNDVVKIIVSQKIGLNHSIKAVVACDWSRPYLKGNNDIILVRENTKKKNPINTHNNHD